MSILLPQFTTPRGFYINCSWYIPGKLVRIFLSHSNLVMGLRQSPPLRAPGWAGCMPFIVRRQYRYLGCSVKGVVYKNIYFMVVRTLFLLNKCFHVQYLLLTIDTVLYSRFLEFTVLAYLKLYACGLATLRFPSLQPLAPIIPLFDSMNVTILGCSSK